jgi:hypothetical protein
MTTVVAVAMGAAGWIIGVRVQSPADAAAGHTAPMASLVTVPVEMRALTATVVAQGTVSYGVPQEITLSGVVAAEGDGEAASSQLVTKAPTAGRTLREGDVLLEVSGRPVFVVTGSVPMYRTLRRGSTGDDVRQVRRAMRRLMPSRNLAPTGPFNDSLIGAVEAWYRKKGYVATGPSSAARTQLRQLEQAVTDAKAANTAPAGGDTQPAGTGRTERRAAPGNTGGAKALADARADLKAFNKTYGVSVASGEILFLPKLPTRLDTVTIKAGAAASGAIGTVADPVLVINGDVGSEDADLLKKGLPATLESTTGASFTATLTGLGSSVASAPAKSDGGSSGDGAGKPTADAAEEGAPADADVATGTPIRLKPTDPKKLARFAGEAVKITIRVGGTEGKVLTVPVAAVFTSADGRVRVSVQTTAGTSRDVPVTTGLSTQGNVEITPESGETLKAGDRVVVGTQ